MDGGNPIALTRTSYAIEAEDLLLATLLERVVGHSNTYYFYERGWRGICVEPNPDLAALYPELRPQDRILNIGIAPKHSGALPYHRYAEPLINGFLSDHIRKMHADNGEAYLGATDVPCLSINDFLERECAKRRGYAE